MDEAIHTEEIREGIQLKGDVIEFDIVGNPSVQKLVDQIETSAEQNGLSFDEMVNKIIRDHISRQMRLEMLKWIHKMEHRKLKADNIEFSNSHDETATLIDVCRSFRDHCQGNSFSQKERQEILILRNFAKDIIKEHQGESDE
jgi:hypothetical protein